MNIDAHKLPIVYRTAPSKSINACLSNCRVAEITEVSGKFYIRYIMFSQQTEDVNNLDLAKWYIATMVAAWLEDILTEQSLTKM